MRSTCRDEDLNTRARIRDAAIVLLAERGVAATSVRAIAAAAGVSPGLVIHHFGGKDALRVACDERVAAIVRERKRKTMRAGAGLDPVAWRDDREGLPIRGYLARTLAEDSPGAAAIVDTLVRDAAEYLSEGVESGLLRPTEHPFERAAVLAIWSLGALVLHEHLKRLLGVDLTAPSGDPADEAAYTGPAGEMLAHGILKHEGNTS